MNDDKPPEILFRLLPRCFDRDKLGKVCKCKGKEDDETCKACGLRKNHFINDTGGF